MGWEPIVPPGAYLANSHGGQGEKRAMLFDIGTGELLGPAELEWVDNFAGEYVAEGADEPSTGLSEEDLELIAAGLLALGIWAAPHLRRFWSEAVAPRLTNIGSRPDHADPADQPRAGRRERKKPKADETGAWAAPRLKRFWAESASPALARARTDALAWAAERLDVNCEQDAAPQPDIVPALVTPEFVRAVDAIASEERLALGGTDTIVMSVAVLLGAAFVAERMRSEEDSSAVDQRALHAMEGVVAKLTAPAFTERVDQMLVEEGAEMESRAQAEMMRVFGGGASVAGEYLPLTNSRVVDALRLPSP